MKVLKFGGTSVGSPERMKGLEELIGTVNGRKIIVLSAVAGTTNTLVDIAQNCLRGDSLKAIRICNDLKEQYDQFVADLYTKPESLKLANELLNDRFSLIQKLLEGSFSPEQEKIILAQGEILSTTLFFYYLKEQGEQVAILPALEFMKTDQEGEPIISFIEEKLGNLLDAHKDIDLFITQGYICQDYQRKVSNLRRGGSDYSASLIGAAIKAEEVQIWTDIDGMHNNDPRVVSNTRPIAHLSFNEAAELAYFGAKILHPQSVFPAQKYNVPVRLLNTMNPQALGTLISKEGREKGVIKAVAAKDGISAIHIHSSRMLMAYGFLRKIFEVFEKYKTPIDMITTSEVAVSLSIDEVTFLDKIVEELQQFGAVDVDQDQTIVCVVGDFGANTHGYAARVLDSVKHLPLRMISYGGSDYNVSILLDTEHKVEALRSLHNRLF